MQFHNCYYNPDTGELPCHTKDLFNRNNILTIHNLITKNCLTSMHKVYLGIAPAAIGRLFSINSDVNRSARRDPEFFAIPRTRLITPDKALPVRGPKIYNYVLNDLRKKKISLYPEQMDLNPFKARVSDYLLGTQKAVLGETWNVNTFPLYTN